MTRTEILQKLAAGEITVDEATRLLKEAASAPEAMASETSAESGASAGAGPEMGAEQHTEAPQAEKRKKARYLKIRVGNTITDREYVKVNIPLSIINAGMLFGARLTNRITADAWRDVVAAFERGEIDTLVEVSDSRDGERVRIYIE